MCADCHRHLPECGTGTRGRAPCGSPARPRLGDLDRLRKSDDSHAAVHRASLECRVANSYGASEFLDIAFECSEGRLHVNSDWVILASVEAAGSAVPAGGLGSTTLLTNLANHVQALFRYDLGDRIMVVEDRCECGSALPVIEGDVGNDDTLWLGAPAVAVVPFALSTVLEDEAGLVDFRLEPTSASTRLLTTGGEGADAERVHKRARSALDRFLVRLGGNRWEHPMPEWCAAARRKEWLEPEDSRHLPAIGKSQSSPSLEQPPPEAVHHTTAHSHRSAKRP